MNKKPLYKNKFFWLISLFILYSGLGFFVVPRVIESQLTQNMESQLNSQTEFEKVRFNPFRFSTHIYKLKLTDEDSQTWFTTDELYANVSLFSSLFGDLTLSELSLKEPHFHLHLHSSDDSTQLKYPNISQNTESTKDQTTQAFHLLINSLSISNGSVLFNDETTSKELKLALKEIEFNNAEFTTRDQFSEFDIFLKTENEDEVELKGFINFSQMVTHGQWNLSKLSTKTIFHLLSDEDNKVLGLKNQQGSITAEGEYHLNMNRSQAEVKMKQLSLSNFKTTEALETAPAIEIPSLNVINTTLNTENNTLEIDSVEISESNVHLGFSKDSMPIWPALLSSHQGTGSDAESNPFQIKVQEISLANMNVTAFKPRLDQEYQQNLSIQNLKLDNFNTSGEESSLELSINPESGGQLSVQLLSENSSKVQSTIIGNQIDITEFQPWIPEHIRVTASSGTLNFEQNLVLDSSEYLIDGRAQLNDIQIFDEAKNTLFEAKSLNVLENKIDSKKHSIVINNIQLDQASGLVVVNPDGVLNLDTVIVKDAMTLDDDTANDSTSDWTVEVNQVEMIDLQSQFIDKSVQPNYQTQFSQVNGQINGLSSENTSKAKLNVSGVVDSYGKFTIDGDINPLSDDAYTDLKIEILDVDLQNFDSYAKKFIGFPVMRGKADLKLDYKLNEKMLKGINDLNFKQLQLGDKIQNDTAVDLPLKLAMALLTDGQGNMPIYLPVSGRIDDPEFSYGGLVFKAFFKLITGIVASPFKLLGKLVPGGADLDMSGVYFQPGTAILLDNEAQKLQAMKNILNQRPSLILEITPSINPVADSKALNQMKLLKDFGWSEVPDFTQEKDIKALKSMFLKTNEINLWNDIEASNTFDGVINTQQLGVDVWTRLLENQPQPDSLELDTLAKNRLLSLQKQLIEEFEIPESRVYVKTKTVDETLPPQIQFGINN